jgi:Tol biopolymer transport system component
MDEKKREIIGHGALQIIVVLLVIANILQAVFLVRSQKESASGRIVYLRENRVDREAPTELVMIDGEGSREQRLGSFTSSPAWSHDGRFIAVGCADPSQICILDARTIPQARVYPAENMRLSPVTVAELDAPQPCVKSGVRIASISWSPTNQELALVCSNADVENQEVCILSLENESSCWNSSESDGVRRVDWSPTNMNQLVISTNSDETPEIYLTDRNGKNRVFLDNGWSPAWSSDGKRIAFFRWKDGVINRNERQWFGGIAAVRPDGTDLTWLYQSWTTSIDAEDKIYYSNSSDCRLDWSPDNRYIVFSGIYNGYSRYIFRLDINSREIILLSNPINRYTHNTDPDWGL